MKHLKPFARLTRWAVAMSALVVVFSLASCGDDTDDVKKPAPSLSLSSTTAENTPGSTVTTTVSINAPEGGQTLDVTVNGVTDAAFTGSELNGSKSQTVEYSYAIPAGASIGATYLISFQATDKKDQVSPAKTFLVTVSNTPSKTIVDVGTDGASTNLETNTNWTADKIYRIHGFVRVGRDVPTSTDPGLQVTGVTLTIQAGTVIYGAPGTPGGTLIVQRGNKIVAEGTSSAPIVFTSAKAPGARKAGDWGGLVICGKAVNNVTAAGTGAATTVTAGLGHLEGAYGGYHGGSDDADNSGVLKYVRLEYAGYPINPNQEINAFTFGSVGSGTTLSYLQSSYSNDDSYEWFGGTVNADHLIAYKGLDDDFDTDNGYRGKVQFGLGIRDYNTADQSGSNGFESDNDAQGTTTTPFTAATFSNMTIIGGKQSFNTAIDIQFQNVAQIRRSSKLNIINSFFTAYPNGIYWDSNLGTTISSINTSDGNGHSVVDNNILAGVAQWGGNGFGSAASADEITALGLGGAGTQHAVVPRGRVVAGGKGAFSANVFGYGANTEEQINSMSPINYFAANNTIKAAWSDASLKIDGSIFEPTAGTPTLLPGAGSLLLTTASDFTGFPGFTAATYIGAFGSTDWTTSWTNWTPFSTDYSH